MKTENLLYLLHFLARAIANTNQVAGQQGGDGASAHFNKGTKEHGIIWRN